VFLASRSSVMLQSLALREVECREINMQHLLRDSNLYLKTQSHALGRPPKSVADKFARSIAPR